MDWWTLTAPAIWNPVIAEKETREDSFRRESTVMLLQFDLPLYYLGLKWSATRHHTGQHPGRVLDQATGPRLINDRWWDQIVHSFIHVFNQVLGLLLLLPIVGHTCKPPLGHLPPLKICMWGHFAPKQIMGWTYAPIKIVESDVSGWEFRVPWLKVSSNKFWSLPRHY